ncbi:MAG: hypothetical protein M0Z53_04465 [Thermaerobacter sp.]|nr:hypothetical protein [Thermaerobacter sp.]
MPDPLFQLVTTARDGLSQHRATGELYAARQSASRNKRSRREGAEGKDGKQTARANGMP